MSRISRICTIFNGLFTSFQFQIHVTVFHTSSTQLSRALYKQHHKSRSPPQSPNARCIVRSHHPAPNIRCTSWVAKLRSSDQRCLPASTKERPHLDASGHVSHVQKPKTKTSSHAHRQSTHGRHTAHELTCLRSSDRFEPAGTGIDKAMTVKTRFPGAGVAAVQPWNLRKKRLESLKELKDLSSKSELGELMWNHPRNVKKSSTSPPKVASSACSRCAWVSKILLRNLHSRSE